MQLRTFAASTMAEALVQVKNELGGDAVILHTRTYHRRRWLGLRRVEVVEIPAGHGLNVPRRQSRPRAQAAYAASAARPTSNSTLTALADSRRGPVTSLQRPTQATPLVRSTAEASRQ